MRRGLRRHVPCGVGPVYRHPNALIHSVVMSFVALFDVAHCAVCVSVKQVLV